MGGWMALVCGRRDDEGTRRLDKPLTPPLHAFVRRQYIFRLWKSDRPYAMTIYRTRYRDPKERRWLWEETRVTAEFWRAEIERALLRQKARNPDRSLRAQSGQVGHRAVFER